MNISVIIPVYNYARFLPEAIDSVLCQTMKPHEIIVVDDGSTDNTREVALKYPITYVYQRHSGLSAARNRGTRESSGDWIAFLDADDCWLPQKLAVQAAAIRDEAFCYCATTAFFRDGSLVDLDFFDDRRVKAVLRRRCVIEPSSVVVRRDALIQVGGFNEKMPAGEDWEMWIRLSRICTFVGVPERLLRYRCFGVSMSSNPEIFLQSTEYIVSAATRDLSLVRRFIETWRLRSVRASMVAVKYRQKGDHRNSLVCAFRAFIYWPFPFHGNALKLLLVELRRSLANSKASA